jgi:hypothetical protein
MDSIGIMHAANLIGRLTADAVQRTNILTRDTFRTRGGRVGSGMGLLLESLWGYHVNQMLDELNENIEIGWIATHEYNDFACMERDVQWDAGSRAGELFRIEIKSMIASADESKAHFDKTVAELDAGDLLVVLLWDWEPFDNFRLFPLIKDYFVGHASEVAQLRDQLHVARGGSFVSPGSCADCPETLDCAHVGEPLNASGKRERITGPKSCKPANAAYAANFGGLKRMLGVRGPEAVAVLADCYRESATARHYIDFIQRNFQGRRAPLAGLTQRN